MINMNEETFYEGGPAKSDLIINLLSGFRVRMRSHTGRRVIKSRRQKGRERIAV